MKNTFILLGFLIGLSFNINAQAVRNANEAKNNQRQIKVSQEELDRDIRELAHFKAKLADLENAWGKKQIKKVNKIKASLLKEMEREISQSRIKLKDDAREIAESKSELNSESRELRQDRRKFSSQRTAANDRSDRRDDARDLSDDKQDYRTQAAVLAKQEEILKILKIYNFSTNDYRLERGMKNKQLIHEFVSTMESDIVLTKLELKEDYREAGEDRRERIEDRRSR